MNETMDKIKCVMCGKELDSPRALVSHDNRAHRGEANKRNSVKWCQGCQAFRPKEDFYKLNDGVYSQCKECSDKSKKEWTETTSKGFLYKTSQSPTDRYISLISWAKRHKYSVQLSKEQYLEMLEKDVCSYCQKKFEGVMFVDLIQEKIGLSYGNVWKKCSLCFVKHKYNIQ